MRKVPDWMVFVIVISIILLAGAGISKGFEYLNLNGSSSFATVFLILIGVISWFVYMAQTDGFSVKKAKNDFKVMQTRNDQRAIEASKMKDVN